MIRGHLIRLRKVYFIPLITTAIITFIIAITFYNISISSFKKIYTMNGRDLTTVYSEKIIQSREIENHLTLDLVEKLTTAASIVILNRDKLSDDYLLEIAERQNIHYIWWFSPDGEVLYDSSKIYVGWRSTTGDPIHNYMISGLDVYVEGIRKSTDTDEYIMVLYMRDIDGYFVETALNADYAKSIIDMYSLDNVVNGMVEDNNNIEYAFVLNKNKSIITDTRPYSSITDIKSYDDAFIGNSIINEKYYSVISQDVLESITPIKVNEEIEYVLVVGYSLNFYLNTRSYLILIVLSIAIGLIVTFGVLEIFQLIKPVSTIENSIISFNLKTGEYEKPKKIPGALDKTFNALDNLSKRLKEANYETKRLYKEIQALALYDPLTKLPNRMYLNEEINNLINNEIKFAIFFIDVVNFKNYNDTFGHIFGDNLLINVANILQNVCNSKCFISRFGGDEFIVIVENCAVEELDTLANKIHNFFLNPIIIDNKEFFIKLSIGISLYQYDGITSKELIENADRAMFESKRIGNKKHIYYKDIKKESQD